MLGIHTIIMEPRPPITPDTISLRVKIRCNSHRNNSLGQRKLKLDEVLLIVEMIIALRAGSREKPTNNEYTRLAHSFLIGLFPPPFRTFHDTL